MVTTVLKQVALVYLVLIVGEVIPIQGQPLSHHAVHSLKWAIQEVRSSSLFQAGAEKSREVGAELRKLFVGASAPDTTIKAEEEIRTTEQRQLRAHLRKL